MSFGPIGRSWPTRVKYAGTYDDAYLEEIFPFLPPDFDDRYYQSAPPDQQIAHPQGGEEVLLVNLTPDGRRRFRLPLVDVPVEFTDEMDERTRVQAALDTIMIEPDLGRLTLVWRASAPLRRGLLGMAECVVGRMPAGWYRAREMGKNYYSSITDLVLARREDAIEENGD